ncbi:MAG: hypothetical protein ACYDCS_13980 [Candidatus Dormibacteria bacterium]
MPPKAFGGGATETVLHPVVLVAMLIAIALMLVLPRKYVLAPFLCVSFLTPVGQEVYIGGLHVFVLRILILIGWVRVVGTKWFSKSDPLSGGFSSIDKVFALWAVLRASAVMLAWGGSSGPVINQVGFLWDSLGAYFFLRFLIRDEEDIVRAIKTFAAITTILAVFMVDEKLRGQNIFGFLGGVPIMPLIRNGSVRAQGPFAHSILAGAFGATLLCLFFWLWKSQKSKLAATLGIIGSTFMVLTSQSSTPVMAYGASILAVCFWPLRKNMRAIRWGIVLVLVALALVMKAPVWFVIAHVDVVSGSGGWDRAELIDVFFRHIGDWWLMGVKSAANWGWDMWDLSNQFVAEGETGGLATLVCFIVMISWCFSRLGKARKIVEGDSKQEWLFWLLGGALVANIFAFFGVSYFDQTRVAWYALLVMISAATAPVLAMKAVPEQDAETRLANSPLNSICSLMPGIGRQNRWIRDEDSFPR